MDVNREQVPHRPLSDGAVQKAFPILGPGKVTPITHFTGKRAKRGVFYEYNGPDGRWIVTLHEFRNFPHDSHQRMNPVLRNTIIERAAFDLGAHIAKVELSGNGTVIGQIELPPELAEEKGFDYQAATVRRHLGELHDPRFIGRYDSVGFAQEVGATVEFFSAAAIGLGQWEHVDNNGVPYWVRSGELATTRDIDPRWATVAIANAEVLGEIEMALPLGGKYALGKGGEKNLWLADHRAKAEDRAWNIGIDSSGRAVMYDFEIIGLSRHPSIHAVYGWVPALVAASGFSEKEVRFFFNQGVEFARGQHGLSQPPATPAQVEQAHWIQIARNRLEQALYDHWAPEPDVVEFIECVERAVALQPRGLVVAPRLDNDASPPSPPMPFF